MVINFKNTLLAFLTISILLNIHPFLGHAGNIELNNLGIREVQRDKDLGLIIFSLKIDVINHGKTKRIFIRFQGTDSEGFELLTESTHGTVETGQTKTLTTKSMAQEKTFDEIVRWTARPR
jgi:hypothetical protein